MIQKMRVTADRIVIDGNDDDWRGLPEVTDARHLAGPDPSRDIVGMAIAPREKDFVVMIRTFGRPSSEPWAYDLFVTDATGDAAQTVAGSRNEDYYCWGRFVRATVAGRVTAVVDGNPDDAPKKGARGPANQVMIDVGDHAAVQYAHLMHGSIRVKVGDVVRVGDLLGQVGNSGSEMAGPHLHTSLFLQRNTQKTVPMQLSHVVVGLNPMADDPWNVSYDRWTPREGYFVQAEKNDHGGP